MSSNGKVTQSTVQDGLTLKVGGTVIDTIQTLQSLNQAASQSKDGRVQALAAATPAMAARSAVSNVAQNGVNVSLSLTVGHSESESVQATNRLLNAGSTLNAGNDLTIRATGGDKDSNIKVLGSTVNAQGNIRLKADNEVNLLAAQDSESQHSKTSSMSAAAGVGISVGTGGMAGGLTGSVSLGRGNEDGKGTTQLNTHVTAGKELVIDSGGDTSIRGAVASGQRVVAHVGGDLNIESLQDKAKFDSKNQSLSVSGTYGAGVSMSGSVSDSSIRSDYASVQEQSGIRAGADGFQINVGGNTDLKGAVISSAREAIDQNRNTLSAGTLTVSDVDNHANVKGHSIGLSGSYGTKAEEGEKSAVSSALPEGWTPMQGPASGVNAPIALGASDSESSVTKSGISAGAISIRDAAAQEQVSGKGAEQAIAGVDREVSNEKDTSGALANNFDKAQLEAAFEVTTVFGQQAGAMLQSYAAQADNLLAEAKKLEGAALTDSSLSDEKRQELLSKAVDLRSEAGDIAKDWGTNGSYRQVTSALLAAASGNVTGSVSQFGTDLLVHYVQQQGASYVGEMVEKGQLVEGSPTHAALHAIVACAGAAASAQNCGAGALGWRPKCGSIGEEPRGAVLAGGQYCQWSGGSGKRYRFLGKGRRQAGQGRCREAGRRRQDQLQCANQDH